jgi:hypothetical protein
MNACLKGSIAWHNSTCVCLWHFYLHCRIEETGSIGIICISCHQVLRHASKPKAMSLGKHWLAKEYIAKLAEFTKVEVTESSCSIVEESCFAILQRQRSPKITMVRIRKEFSFDH